MSLDKMPQDKMTHGKLTDGQNATKKKQPRQNTTVLLFVNQDDSVDNTPQDEMLPNVGINVQSLSVLRLLLLYRRLSSDSFSTVVLINLHNCMLVLHRGTRLITPPPVGTGSGVLFSLDFFLSLFVCLYLCFFVSKITRKRLDRFAWNFQGRCGVTMGRPDSILGQFGWTARPKTPKTPKIAQNGDLDN